MILQIKSKELTNSKDTSDFLIDTPSMCPHCGVAINPQILSSNFIQVQKLANQKIYRIFVTFLCNNCMRAFSSEYKYSGSLHDASFTQTEYKATYPTYHSSVEHSEEIKNLSP